MGRTAWSVGFVVVLLIAAVPWLQSQRDDAAFEQFLAKGKPYAARQLELTGTLPPALAETSGLAVSRTQPGVFWTHNDSGDGPNLYAIDMSGRLLATFQLAGAAARDWEDMSSGSCVGDLAPVDAANCLYLADIGDNDGVRSSVAVYVAAEPMVSRDDASARTIPSRSFRFRYPNGPDDAEALAVLPDGDVVIVSKGRSGAIAFFRLRRDAIVRAVDSGEVLVAEDAGDTGIRPEARIGRNATSAAVSPDGSTLAVRTYYEVYFFRVVKAGDAVSWRPTGNPCFLGDAESQGEAIDYLDADTLLLTSERGRGTAGLIHRVRC
jgi:hypothetical protein